MNHELRVSPLLSPKSILREWDGGKGGWDTEETRRGHSTVSVPPPGCDHRTREPSCFPPLHSRIVPKHHPNPRALPEHPQSTAGLQPAVPIHNPGGFAPLHPKCYRSTAPKPPVTVGFACWEPLALLQGPLANVNAFFSLESSLDDLPEQISHASPKIMPFAFPALEKKHSQSCWHCAENGCMGPHVREVRAKPTGGLPPAPPPAHSPCSPLHPPASPKISLHPGIPSISSHPLYIPCISASSVSPHISSHPPAAHCILSVSPTSLHPHDLTTSLLYTLHPFASPYLLTSLCILTSPAFPVSPHTSLHCPTFPMFFYIPLHPLHLTTSPYIILHIPMPMFPPICGNPTGTSSVGPSPLQGSAPYQVWG